MRTGKYRRVFFSDALIGFENGPSFYPFCLGGTGISMLVHMFWGDMVVLQVKPLLLSLLTRR